MSVIFAYCTLLGPVSLLRGWFSPTTHPHLSCELLKAGILTHLSLHLEGLEWGLFEQWALSIFFKKNMELSLGKCFGICLVTAGVRGHGRQPSGGLCWGANATA